MARKSKTERTLRLVRPPSPDVPGIFSIAAKDGATYYAFQEIPCEVGGRGFAVHRLGLGQLYHVRIGRPAECSCECLGYLRHGNCKHVAAILELVNRVPFS